MYEPISENDCGDFIPQRATFVPRNVGNFPTFGGVSIPPNPGKFPGFWLVLGAGVRSTFVIHSIVQSNQVLSQREVKAKAPEAALLH